MIHADSQPGVATQLHHNGTNPVHQNCNSRRDFYPLEQRQRRRQQPTASELQGFRDVQLRLIVFAAGIAVTAASQPASRLWMDATPDGMAADVAMNEQALVIDEQRDESYCSSNIASTGGR